MQFIFVSPPEKNDSVVSKSNIVVIATGNDGKTTGSRKINAYTKIIGL